jgi:hypothetical protein
MNEPKPGLRKSLQLYKQDPLHTRQQNLWSRLVSIFERNIKRFLPKHKLYTDLYEKEEARSQWAIYVAEFMENYREKTPPSDSTNDTVQRVFLRLEADRKRQSRYLLHELPDRIDGFRTFVYSPEIEALFDLGCTGRLEAIHFYFLLSIIKGLKVSEAADLLCVPTRKAQRFVHKLLEEMPKLIEGKPYQLPQLQVIDERWLYRQTRYVFGDPNWLDATMDGEKALRAHRQRKNQAR